VQLDEFVLVALQNESRSSPFNLREGEEEVEKNIWTDSKEHTTREMRFS